MRFWRRGVPEDAAADADLIADTTTGRVSLSSAALNPGNRSQLHTRLGAGGRKITLSSQAGNIAIVDEFRPPYTSAISLAIEVM